MENEWADWIKYGQSKGTAIEIDIKIKVHPPGQVRPDRFTGRYIVFETGSDGIRRKIVQRPIKMENNDAQVFDRIYFRTDNGGIMHQIPSAPTKVE